MLNNSRKGTEKGQTREGFGGNKTILSSKYGKNSVNVKSGILH